MTPPPIRRDSGGIGPRKADHTGGGAKLQDILFEIGTEELPATNLADIFETAQAAGENILETRLKKILEEKRLGFESIKVFATPRRIVFWVQGVPAAQSAKDQLTKVLSKEEAYSGDGVPTEKFLTILKHRGVFLKDVFIQTQGAREFAFIKKAEPVLKVAAVLPEIFSALIRSLAFPKNMKWNDSGISFPRPIRNLLCLYGNQVVRFGFGDLKAGNQTLIFSKSKRTRHAVKDIPSYFRLLRQKGVLLDPAERKKAISQSLEILAASLGAKCYDDPFLLSEVNFLVERPATLAAPFGEEFLTLPVEVLAVSMARQQRIFGVVGIEGKLKPKFLAVLDGAATATQKKIISKNMEYILHAKLKDSLFFYKEDTKTFFGDRLGELRGLVFIKGAGSMFEKINRLVKLAKKFGPQIFSEHKDREILERACVLSKGDLLTQLVGEFPELQGIMGKYYALDHKESPQVAQAIGEQYLPRTVHDRLPGTPHGSLLSIFDKVDLVIACFKLGLEPTSSLDPYGLRRSAAAILKIILDKNFNLSLPDLLNSALQELGFSGAKDKETIDKLNAFFKDRFKALCVDRGIREDVVEAVMASGFEFPCRVHDKVRLLGQVLKEPFFPQAWKVVERTVNILKGNKEILPERIDPALFTEDLERRVHEHYQAAREGITKAAHSSDLRLATSLYAEAFFAILGEFFEKVFVNAEDSNVRRNRLALLKAVGNLYTDSIADLSRIRLS